DAGTDTGAHDSGAAGDSGTHADSSSSTDTAAPGDAACTCGDHVCHAPCESATSCPADCGELVFDDTDARRTTSTGDWAIGDWKAECGTGEAMQGISASCYGLFCGAHSALCTADAASTWSHA